LLGDSYLYSGLIPRNRAPSQAVSETIMGSLLTPSELQNLARRLLHNQSVFERNSLAAANGWINRLNRRKQLRLREFSGFAWGNRYHVCSGSSPS